MSYLQYLKSLVQPAQPVVVTHQNGVDATVGMSTQSAISSKLAKAYGQQNATIAAAAIPVQNLAMNTSVYASRLVPTVYTPASNIQQTHVSHFLASPMYEYATGKRVQRAGATHRTSTKKTVQSHMNALGMESGGMLPAQY